MRSPRSARPAARAVQTGAVQTSSETFDAGAYSSATFSCRKLCYPLLRPAAAKAASSRRFSARSRRGASGRMQRYPNAKRMRKISAGVSPAAISALVETNVAAHTETVKSAANWYQYSDKSAIRLQK